ncbi:MAG: hypothetical protein LBT92_01200 [Rickettsiales bacterium]|jgi:hypothetical protein|nr:hypothetical protein [Rickettsiales bacterium]
MRSKVPGLAAIFLYPAAVFAQADESYYNSFYDDYYKSYPRPAAAQQQQQYYQQAVAQQQGYAQPQPQYQQPAAAQRGQANPYAYQQQQAQPASFYNGSSGDHPVNQWEIEARYTQSIGNFYFESDVGSILTWDETKSTEYMLKGTRDIMYNGRQLILTGSYTFGNLTTSRTSDDDIYNELHLMSLGKGSAKLASWNVGVGLRNKWRYAGFNISPIIGWKQKVQKFEMQDHADNAPYYFQYLCDNGIIDETDPDYGLCGDIDLTSTGKFADIDLTDAVYWMDPNTGDFLGYAADEDPNLEDTEAEWWTIPEFDALGYDQFYYGMLVPEEDFCYETYADGVYACLEMGEGGENILLAFGGVSSLGVVDGTTHIYHVTWAGPYAAIDAERAISPTESLNVYAELFKPTYTVWGNWPNRDDWMHDPSFWDKSGTFAGWGYLFEASYQRRISDTMKVVLGANFEYLTNKNADTILRVADGDGNLDVEETFPDAILVSTWYNIGAFVGVKMQLN